MCLLITCLKIENQYTFVRIDKRPMPFYLSKSFTDVDSQPIFLNSKATPIVIDKPSDAMYHILVIDDEKGILNVVQTALSRAGFKVDTALGGQKGLQKFDSGQFDLVITDILMPGIDGREIVKHIRKSDRPYTPIIGFSGTPWLIENNQFDAVFTKPFPLEDLVNSVQHLSMQAGALI